MTIRVGTAFARHLRASHTDAEAKLWGRLRARRLGGFKFRRQFPIDRYVADFVCIEAKLIVELDGGQHAERVEYDAERTRVLEACGFQVLRFWNSDVLVEADSVIDAIWLALNWIY